MTEDEADMILSTSYPDENLISYREIDEKIEAISQGLHKIEVSLQVFEELKDKANLKGVSPERMQQLHKSHQDLAVTLVALKKRRAQYFRPLEN